MQLTLVLAVAFNAFMLLAVASAQDLNERHVESGLQQVWDRVQVNVDEVRDELDSLKKEEALQKLKKILGIRNRQAEERREELPPQFMMELYNAVTDSAGKTRRKNPYDAKVVRSFIEKDTSSSSFYLFNISDLDDNESILEAELHLYRRRSPPESMHPSVLTSPHYLLKVYQVLPDKSADEPDLHRLLNVHYVGAYASGWQVFNVKQAVLSWLSNSPNLGLLVTATTIFGDRVTVDFSRRGDESHDKQPILVLFNDDRAKDRQSATVVDEAEEEDELDEAAQLERKKRQLELTPVYDENDERPIYFRRVKKAHHEKLTKPRDENAIEIPRRHSGIVSRRQSFEQTLTSMDIYQRAMLREKLNSRKKAAMRENQQQQRHRHSGDTAAHRAKREVDGTAGQCRKVETEPCSKRELYVNFKDIGLTEIIAPEGYSAYQCKGHCKSPLSQDQKPTNHATIQGIVHKMNLAQSDGVEMPCCVPVSLSSISILYHDNDKDGVVLKSYEDMSVVSCGCR